MKAWFNTRKSINIMYYYGRWMDRNCIIIPVEDIITKSIELTNMNYTNYTKFFWHFKGYKQLLCPGVKTMSILEKSVTISSIKYPLFFPWVCLFVSDLTGKTLLSNVCGNINHTKWATLVYRILYFIFH